MRQLLANDTRRYVSVEERDKDHKKNIDEMFASTRKYILEKYHTIKGKKVDYGGMNSNGMKLHLLLNKGEKVALY